MIQFFPPDYTSFLSMLRLVGWLTAGGSIGTIYFLTLRWNVTLYVSGKSVPLAITVQLARLGVMVISLAIIAHQFGALPLLTAAAGVLAARTAILRWGPQP